MVYEDFIVQRRNHMEQIIKNVFEVIALIVAMVSQSGIMVSRGYKDGPHS
jgi:hypothetical protein